MPARDWAFQGGAGHAQVVSKCSDPQKMAACVLQEKGPVDGRGPGCCGGPDGQAAPTAVRRSLGAGVSGYAVLLGVGNHHLTVLLLTCFFGRQRKCGLGGGHFMLCSLFVQASLGLPKETSGKRVCPPDSVWVLPSSCFAQSLSHSPPPVRLPPGPVVPFILSNCTSRPCLYPPPHIPAAAVSARTVPSLSSLHGF